MGAGAADRRDAERDLEAVRADRSLIPAAFAETLRFALPVHMIMRQPSEDVELSGGVVEAGRTVTCLFADGAPPPEYGVFTRAPQSLRLTFTPTR